MYFNGAINQFGVGVRIIILTLEGEVVPIAKKLEFRVMNNEPEYEACTMGMEALIALGVIEAKIFRDSILVIKDNRRMGIERTILEAILEPPIASAGAKL